MKQVSAALILATIALSMQGCCKGGDSCPSRYTDLPADKRSGEASCTCAAGAATGAVWGTDIYTTDSSICAAAAHAGVIPASGGTVKLKSASGCPSYRGVARNGITSGDWGSYDNSFYFVGQGTGKCTAATASDACPARFRDVPGLSAATELTCKCSAASASGSVWGTDIYTQDSSVCAAAVHAGEIPATGGTVKAKAAAGCKSYKGTTRNGISTSEWGTYDNSFYFPKKGTGACP